MTSIPALLIVLALLTPHASAANHSRQQPDAESPERLAAAAQAFAEARDACEQDGGKLWGRSLWGPILLIDPATRRFVASQAVRPDAEEEAEATQPVNAGQVILHVGTLPQGRGIANTAFDYAGGRWSMVVWPVPDTPEARRQLLCHELWHRVQGELGIPLDTPSCDHLEAEQGRLWLRLELRALASALRAEDDAARNQAIADALRFRARRHSLFEGAGEKERKLELAEGLAEYTGLALSGRADRAGWAAENLESAEQGQSLSRSFPYATGPGYGMLLARADADWTRRVHADTSLPDMLGDAMNISPRLPPADADLQAAEGRYGGAEVRRQEQERARRQDAQRRRLTAALVEGPVLHLRLTPNARISFNPRAVTPFRPHGTVYPTATVTDAWGELTVTDSHVLITTDWKAARVPAPKPPDQSPDRRTVTGDGWRLALNDGWRITPEGDGWIITGP